MTAIERAPLIESRQSADARQKAAFDSMRLSATALLVAMCILFIVASFYSRAHWGWSFVRAFAEAAMVGGLADWFAVTAIFRRPFGLPIPHTAVIARSKDRIGSALGDFIADNFLAPANVHERLHRQDITSALAHQIIEPANASRLADSVVSAVPALLDTFDEAAITEFLRKQTAAFAADGRASSSIGALLELITDQGRHEPVVEAALEEAWRALAANEETIRAKVRDKTSFLWRLISVDSKAADAMIGALETLLRDALSDPNHPARQRITEMLRGFSNDLRHSPEMRAKVEHVTEELLSHPAVGQFLKETWNGFKDALRKEALAPDSKMHGVITDIFIRVGQDLLEDDEAREALNDRLRKLAVALAERHGRDVSRLAADTIKSWDAETIVAKLEQNVGRDLQYIRISGTIIGGLVGLVIHTAAFAVHFAGKQ
ncbi:MAG: DUF445 domain-containing protein [Caulobacterales bacterium]